MSVDLIQATNLDLLPHSLVRQAGAEFALARKGLQQQLLVFAHSSSNVFESFYGESATILERTLLVCPLTSENADSLRLVMPWLRPQPLGLNTSAGLGDRLGLATPGHVRAIRATGSQIAPIFSQQSIRENTRTGRTPRQVLDDATWGAFAEGWQGVLGADADHLKTTEDIDSCLACGYSFFTIDPGTHVDNRAETANLNELRQMAKALPVEVLPSASGLTGRSFTIEHLTIHFDELTLLKAAVKYGRAVQHVARMYHHLLQAAGVQPVELEVSVDETEQPTTHAEHVYIANELQRLGVRWVSLAPRYVGRFEKGVDYIGDLKIFEADFAGHAAIARHFGPYKLSLHSGSDKFSIYPIAARLTDGLVHLKTAGTSYLEALRTVAAVDVPLFRDIYTFAREHYEADRASYHVSASLDHTPMPGTISSWPALLDQFDAREIFHVTFGSVLRYELSDGSRPFFDSLVTLIKTNPEVYAANLERHFIRHLTPFLQPTYTSGFSG
jgi:hypothetical protein